MKEPRFDNSSLGVHLFQSEAWLSAWRDTYGALLGDNTYRFNPLVNNAAGVYISQHKLRHWLSFRRLQLIGTASQVADSPRAEYNDIHLYVEQMGGISTFSDWIKTKSWQQLYFPDVTVASIAGIKQLAQHLDGYLKRHQQEYAFSIFTEDFDQYLAGLSSSIRRRYFNQRKQLLVYGDVERLDLNSWDEFVAKLNGFHQSRFGRDCYSPKSIQFIKLLLQKLAKENGYGRFNQLSVNGQPVSVVFDIFYQQRWYNLQSGFADHGLGSLALGSLHLGYLIEDAIHQHIEYDLLAGTGKLDNYKVAIATHRKPISTWSISKGWLKELYRLKDMLSKRGDKQETLYVD